VSSREFAEWQAFFKTQPFGHERFDLGFAVVAATVANSAPREKPSHFTVEDFLLFFSEEARAELSAERLRQKLDATFGAPE
jgi:hypothetical protein